MCEEEDTGLKYVYEDELVCEIDSIPTLGKKRKVDSLEDNSQEETKYLWSDAAIRLLLDIYREYSPKVGKHCQFKTRKKLFEFMAEEFANNGYTVSASNVENKWKTLKRQYRNFKYRKLRAGKPIGICKYEKEIDEIFLADDTMQPEWLLTASELDDEDSPPYVFEEPSPPSRNYHFSKRRNSAVEQTQTSSKVFILASKHQWDDASTRLLLQLYREYSPQVGKHSKLRSRKMLWEFLTEEINKQGYMVSADNVESKWKALKRQYRKCKFFNRKGSPRRMKCSYEKELQEILLAEDELSQDNSFGASDGDNEDSKFEPCSYRRFEKSDPLLGSPRQLKKRNLAAEQIKLQKQKIAAYRERSEILREKNQILQKLLEKLINSND